MHALTDSLEDFDVDGRCAAVVAVIFVLGIADDAVAAAHGSEDVGGGAGNLGNDGAGVEGVDGGVHVDGVGVKDGRVLEWGQQGRGEVAGEGVLIGAAKTDE